MFKYFTEINLFIVIMDKIHLWESGSQKSLQNKQSIIAPFREILPNAKA